MITTILMIKCYFNNYDLRFMKIWRTGGKRKPAVGNLKKIYFSFFNEFLK